MNREYCGKCYRRSPGGTGTGRQYRCAKCHAERMAAMLTRPQRQNHDAQTRNA